ncbi:MAG: replication-associated recombination protein A [Parvularculaceae bacterium]
MDRTADLFADAARVETGRNATRSDGGGPDAPLRPLADRLRPTRLDDVVGQSDALGENGPLRRMAASGRLSSFILWGPPGVGKTTIALLMADAAGARLERVSAVAGGVAELRKAFDRARAAAAAGRATALFVDEIHRFNRAQQDALLPAVEAGEVALIGATTENPSFALNGALLSRAQVVVLKPLAADDLSALLDRAEAVLGAPTPLTADGRAALIHLSNGDGRYALNLLEIAIAAAADDDGGPLDGPALARAASRRAPIHDKSGDAHYDLASALQKSIRGSDVDAALYWAARMLVAGEDPRFLLRRLVVVASEDVGNAAPHALSLAVAARDAYEFLGQPEGEIAIGQLVAYLGAAPKSNRAHMAVKAAKAAARETAAAPPPPHALNAPTRLMKELGRTAGYVYDHDAADAFAGLDYFPEGLPRSEFYEPRDVGAEAAMAHRLNAWRAARAERTSTIKADAP